MLRNCLITLAAATAMMSAPALAGNQGKQVKDREPGVRDVAATPVTDLNLRKDKIPEVLIAAQVNPYDLDNLRRCGSLIAAVEELDAILGDDLDLPQDVRRGPSAGRMAQSVVGSFIPFRSIVREVSGASQHKRDTQAAIQAGLARRGFLKGVGQSKSCRYPARPAGPKELAAHQAAVEAAEAAEKD